MKRNLTTQGPRRMQKSGSARLPVTAARTTAFFSFTYSHREISESGGRTRIRSRTYRLENGKFESKEFDGTLDGPVYSDAVQAAQDLAVAQARSFLGLFSAFLPFSSKGK